ncbi:MAG: integrase [Nitrososphaeraceae archaeon]
MKITREDLQSIKEEPIELFYQGIKSEATRNKYTRTLRRILCETLEDILEGSFEERARQLVKMAKSNPEWMVTVLLTISKKLKERTKLDPSDKNYLNPNSVPNKFKPIRKLLEMNAVAVAWNRVYATFPEQNNNYEGSGYTRQEIQKMLNFTKGAMDKAIILVASSSGIREGGLLLKWEDVTPVYKVSDKIVLDITESESKDSVIVCAIITVYRNTNETYPAFITPEAYKALMDYKTVWTKEVGREPKPNEPLFKQAGLSVRALSAAGIKQRAYRVVESAGIRSPLVGGKRRYDIPIMNGFRRFFNKTNKETISKDSPLSALIKKEYMMDHVGLVKLDRNYFKTHVVELVEEYLNAVPHLTISDEERVKAEKLKLEKEKTALEAKNEEIERLKEKFEEDHKKVMQLDEVNELFQYFINIFRGKTSKADDEKFKEKYEEYEKSYIEKAILDPSLRKLIPYQSELV